MKDTLFWLLIIFFLLVAFERFDILHNIGGIMRTGVEAIQDGYNSGPKDSIKE